MILTCSVIFINCKTIIFCHQSKTKKLIQPSQKFFPFITVPLRGSY